MVDCDWHLTPPQWDMHPGFGAVAADLYVASLCRMQIEEQESEGILEGGTATEIATYLIISAAQVCERQQFDQQLAGQRACQLNDKAARMHFKPSMTVQRLPRASAPKICRVFFCRLGRQM